MKDKRVSQRRLQKVFDENFDFLKTIETFQNGEKVETLSMPAGIFAKNNKIYISDTENNRVLIMRLLRDNIRNFEILKFITKEDCGVQIIKSVVINVIRNKKQGNIEKEGI